MPLQVLLSLSSISKSASCGRLITLNDPFRSVPQVLAALEDEPLEVGTDGVTKGCQYASTTS